MISALLAAAVLPTSFAPPPSVVHRGAEGLVRVRLQAHAFPTPSRGVDDGVPALHTRLGLEGLVSPGAGFAVRLRAAFRTFSKDGRAVMSASTFVPATAPTHLQGMLGRVEVGVGALGTRIGLAHATLTGGLLVQRWSPSPGGRTALQEAGLSPEPAEVGLGPQLDVAVSLRPTQAELGCFLGLRGSVVKGLSEGGGGHPALAGLSPDVRAPDTVELEAQFGAEFRLDADARLRITTMFLFDRTWYGRDYRAATLSSIDTVGNLIVGPAVEIVLQRPIRSGGV